MSRKTDAKSDAADAVAGCSLIRSRGGADPQRYTHRLLPALGWCLRVVLALLFFYAGYVKLLQPADFLQDILNYQLVDARLALWLALTLPPLEILLALCLLIRATALPAALLTAGLCTVFLLALLSAWWRGLDIACGCFGAGAPVSYPQTVLRDIVLIAAAAGVAVIVAKAQGRTGR